MFSYTLSLLKPIMFHYTLSLLQPQMWTRGNKLTDVEVVYVIISYKDCNLVFYLKKGFLKKCIM